MPLRKICLNKTGSLKSWDVNNDRRPSTVEIAFRSIQEDRTGQKIGQMGIFSKSKKEVFGNDDTTRLRKKFDSNSLTINASFSFGDQKLKISFASKEFDWKPVSLSICYDFIGETRIVNAPEEVSSVSAHLDYDVQINLNEFDRHCLQGDFTIEFKFVYIEDKDAKVQSANYKADVS